MYWPDVVELKGFYGSTLGSAVCRRLRFKLRKMLPELYDEKSNVPLTVLGVGYVVPYLQPLVGKKSVVSYALMPSAQGVIHWPEKEQNRAVFSKETALPFGDQTIDRIIIVHGLEHSNFPQQMLDEIYRVLVPKGKIVVIVPNRMSIWARQESSPFGYGHPYSVKQLQQLLENSQFNAVRVEMGLLFPPTKSRIILRMAEWLFRLAQKLVYFPVMLCSWGGVIIIEAEKQVFATHLDHKPAMRRGFLYRPVSASFGRMRIKK